MVHFIDETALQSPAFYIGSVDGAAVFEDGDRGIYYMLCDSADLFDEGAVEDAQSLIPIEKAAPPLQRQIGMMTGRGG